MKIEIDCTPEEYELAQAKCQEQGITLTEAVSAWIHHIAVFDDLTMIEEWRNEELNIDEA